MDTREAYNNWSKQYDTNENKTRDLEAKSLREVLTGITFNSCLEIGCGTGKNTEWLVTKSKHVTAVDLSEEMQALAKQKVNLNNVGFVISDIISKWDFVKNKYDLITFSLVLEHIENLDHIFSEASKAIVNGGLVYVGELHPFKQYSGTKARFETEKGTQVLQCFNHNISDFTGAAEKYGFKIVGFNEYFDENNRKTIPRIITLLFKKS